MSRNPEGGGISEAPRPLLDEVVAIVEVIGVVFANLTTDLLYVALNPRIRYDWRR